MPVYPSFREKLRLGEKYPSMPVASPRRENYPLYDKFLEQQNQSGRIQLAPPDQPQFTPERPIEHTQYQFNDKNMSEQARGIAAARTAHDVDLQPGRLTPYQRGQLDNKQAELGIRAEQYGNVNDINQQKVGNAERMNEWERNNPGVKLYERPGGETIAIGPGGQVMGNYGASGIMTDSDKIAATGKSRLEQIAAQGMNAQGLEKTRQGGRVELGELAAGNAQALQRQKQFGTSTGTNRSSSYKLDAAGNVIGVDTTTKNTYPQATAPGTDKIMYGPNGKAYRIPADQVEDATKNGMTFEKK